MRVSLGKVKRCDVGFGGYDDAMIGVSWELGGPDWSCQDFWGTWATWDERCKWTPDDQTRTLGNALLRLKEVLRTSGVRATGEVLGVPVEVTFDGEDRLASWRVLTEVL